MTSLCDAYAETARVSIRRISTRQTGQYTLSCILSETTDAVRRYYSITTAILPPENPLTDICTAADITGDREEADRLFDLIAEGCVMPCTLEDVVSDLLA